MNLFHHIRAKVHGRVQGVCFRDSARREAVRLDLSGWVRNCSDGSVEICYEGPVEAVEKMSGWLRKGPIFAKVKRVEVLRDEPLEYEPVGTFSIVFGRH